MSVVAAIVVVAFGLLLIAFTGVVFVCDRYSFVT